MRCLTGVAFQKILGPKKNNSSVSELVDEENELSPARTDFFVLSMCITQKLTSLSTKAQSQHSFIRSIEKK